MNREERNRIIALEKRAKEEDLSAQSALVLMIAHNKVIPGTPKNHLKWIKATARRGVREAQRLLGDIYYGNRLYIDEPGISCPETELEPFYPFLERIYKEIYNELELEPGDDPIEIGGVLPNEKFKEEALKWYRRAAQRGDTLGKFRMAQAYADGALVKRDEKQIIKWCLKAAYKADGQLLREIGIKFAKGYDLFPIDETHATEFFRKAANKNDHISKQIIGHLNLGMDMAIEKATGIHDRDVVVYNDALFMGTILKDQGDLRDAVEQCRKSASEGHVLAQSYLGDILLSGNVSIRNPEEAHHWYMEAAKQGDASAHDQLGTMHFYGDGVTINYRKAALYFRAAALQGDANAMCNLASLYQRGIGVPKDHKEAIRWLENAAELGDSKASTFLGYITIHGLDVPRNQPRGYNMLLKAANEGYAPAQCKLGLYYMDGHGLLKNLGEAEKWLTLAAIQGDLEALSTIVDLMLADKIVKLTSGEVVKWLFQGGLTHLSENDKKTALQYLSALKRLDSTNFLTKRLAREFSNA